MRLRFYAAVILFLGSYLPLSVILLVQNFRYELWGSKFCIELTSPDCAIPLRQPIISLSFVLICFLCFLFTLITLRAIKVRQKIDITEVKHIPADLMNYVLPYIVSFMGLDYGDIGKFIGFTVFLLWIFIITYKSDRIIMNPVLTVFGWKLFEVKYNFPGGQSIFTSIALSNKEINTNDTYRIHHIQDVLVIK